MNNIVKNNNDNIDQITKDILELKTQTVENMIEIGKKLIEVKEQLPHGQFGKYLKEEVDFTQNCANKYMRIVNEFSNCITLHNLQPSKLIILLDVPKQHIDEFTKENDLKNMSCRSIRGKIKELKKAKKKENKTKQNKSEKTQNTKQKDFEDEIFEDFGLEEFEEYDPFSQETIEEYNQRKEEFNKIQKEKFKEYFKSKKSISKNQLNLTEKEKKLLKDFYRTLSKKYHPDKGGDAEAMRLINQLKKQWGI